MTSYFKISSLDRAADIYNLRTAAAMLSDGKVVAFPTETVYGLGADARNDGAVQRIFHAKGRPSDNPLIVHLSHISQLEDWVDADHPYIAPLAKQFWPGPLTIVLPIKNNRLSRKVTAGLDTLAIRIPSNPVALKLIELAGCPVAAPSANRSGRPSPTRAEHVMEDLSGRIDAVVDGGSAEVGLESTVIQLTEERINVLRPGGISVEQLHQAVSGARIVSEQTAASTKVPRSPGMKYTHYAPQGELTVVIPSSDNSDAWSQVHAYIHEQLKFFKQKGARTGVLAFSEHTAKYKADLVQSLGSREKLEQGAHALYEALRNFDRHNISVMFAEGCFPKGMGLALLNRLSKAAGNRIVHLNS